MKVYDIRSWALKNHLNLKKIDSGPPFVSVAKPAAFIAATGKAQDLHQLQAQLGVYSGVAPDISGPAASKKPSEDYQLAHTASLMLIDPHGRWVGTFNYGIKPDELIHGIQSSISP